MMVDVIKAAARVFRAHGLERYEDITTMGADRVWGIMPSPTHYLERNGGITMYTRFGGGGARHRASCRAGGHGQPRLE